MYLSYVHAEGISAQCSALLWKPNGTSSKKKLLKCQELYCHITLPALIHLSAAWCHADTIPAHTHTTHTASLVKSDQEISATSDCTSPTAFPPLGMRELGKSKALSSPSKLSAENSTSSQMQKDRNPLAVCFFRISRKSLWAAVRWMGRCFSLARPFTECLRSSYFASFFFFFLTLQTAIGIKNTFLHTCRASQHPLIWDMTLLAPLHC